MTSRWITPRPVVFYPWENHLTKDLVLHDLIMDMKPRVISHLKSALRLSQNSTTIEQIIREVEKKSLEYLTGWTGDYRLREDRMRKAIEMFGRKYWMDNINTTDGTSIKYYKLFPNVSQILEKVSKVGASKDCYILSLINPAKPHLELVDCIVPLLKYFVCEDIQEKKFPPLEVHDVIQLSSSTKCKPGGEYVSTLFLCDGYEDCSDGSDEKNCSCFVNGNIVSDSKYCTENCTLSKNCSCSSLYYNSDMKGCSSYQHNSEEVMIRPMLTFLCRNSSEHIDILLVNDFVIDCPFGDDEKELLNMSIYYENKCSYQNRIECYPGHTKCYDKEQRCVYLLQTYTNKLFPCRNGKHLQGCYDFQCQTMYKCINSYCIPYKYVCNGQWDCWNGEDEVLCKAYTCKKMYKCRKTSICIHTKNICDGISDCFLKDDEKLCDVQHCVPHCSCLNYGIICKRMNILQLEMFERQLQNFIFIHLSKIKALLNYVNSLKSTKILISIKNNMMEPFTCRLDGRNISLQLLDLSMNKIAFVAKYHFICMPLLSSIDLKLNMISVIKQGVFNSLLEINVIDLTKNNIKCVFRCSFCGLTKLRILKIAKNQIHFIDQNSFIGTRISLILTSVFQICCINEESSTICTAKAPWSGICVTLVSNKGMKIVTLIVTVFMLIITLSQIIKYAYMLHTVKVLKHFEVMNLTHVCFCSYISIIFYNDTLYGASYAEIDLIWRSSLACYLASILHLFTIYLVPVFHLLKSYTRYSAVKYPFKKSDKTSLIACFLFLFIILVAILVMFFRQYVENLTFLSSPICLLIGNAGKSQVENILTACVSGYLLISICIEIMMSLSLIQVLNNSEKIVKKSRKKYQTVIANVFIRTVIYSASWLPVATYFCVSIIFVQLSRNTLLLYSVTLVVMPVNFMVSLIQSEYSELKKLVQSAVGILMKESWSNK